MPSSETGVVGSLHRAARSFGYYPQKLADQSTSGIPDNYIVGAGCTAWIEVKRSTRVNQSVEKLVTPAQKVTLLRIQKRSGAAWVVSYHVRSKQFIVYRPPNYAEPFEQFASAKAAVRYIFVSSARAAQAMLRAFLEER